MSTYLITAVTSCTGQAFYRRLSCMDGTDVHGLSRQANEGRHNQLTHHVCDVTDDRQLNALLHKVQPDTVVHLAGCSDARQPSEMIKTNIAGTWNLLSACQSLQRPLSVLLIGSAASFGPMRGDETSLGSSRDAAPSSLYGQTRQTALELGRLVDDNIGLRVYLCRTFNLIGPELATRYVPAALVRRIRDASMRGQQQVAVRDLDSVRDFIDVRDAVDAYLAILERGRTAHPYSVGRGTGVSIRELAEKIVAAMEIDLEIVADHPCEPNPRSGISRSIADPSDLLAETGWVPKISLETSICDMLDSPLATNY